MGREFYKVATVNDIPPGKTRKVRVEGHAVLLANVDGTVYAVDDSCTHEDSSLALGCLKGALVSCTLHGSRFDVRSGEPMEEPARTPLQTYTVRIEGSDILLEFPA